RPKGTPRSAPGRYALAGLLICHHCGRKMQGSHTRGHAFYRCRMASPDYAAPPADHPRTLAVRESRVLPLVDSWLVEMFAPERVAALAAQIVAADEEMTTDPRLAAARRQAAEAQRKLERHLSALEAGVDPGLIAGRTRSAQADLAAAQAVLASGAAAVDPITVEEVLATLEVVRNTPGLLDHADPHVRSEIYNSLGIGLAYRRDNGREFLRVQATLQGVDLNRVGGGT
ncbi:MAG: recombinase zinc ribbon domain-containing protein, partial [Acidimicrobiales bacterium]